MRAFVPVALAAGLDFSALQRVNAKFHTDRRSARRREGDVIWRLPTREGTDIYLLLEFQSDVDWRMAVRTQVYQGLLWQQVIDEKELKIGARIPPLLLVVLYNGVSRWNASTDIRERIALSSDSPLWPWQPQVRYHLLDMGAFPGSQLARRAGLAALLFRLERRLSFKEYETLAGRVGDWFRRHPRYTELKRLFGELIHRASKGLRKNVPKLEKMSVFRSNLDTLGEIWKQEWKAEGLAEGKAEGKAKGLAEGKARGRAEGRAEGKAEALVCLLTARFGTVRPSLLKRIRAANLTTLNRWFKRAITASDLSSVFA